MKKNADNTHTHTHKRVPFYWHIIPIYAYTLVAHRTHQYTCTSNVQYHSKGNSHFTVTTQRVLCPRSFSHCLPAVIV